MKAITSLARILVAVNFISPVIPSMLVISYFKSILLASLYLMYIHIKFSQEVFVASNASCLIVKFF